MSLKGLRMDRRSSLLSLPVLLAVCGSLLLTACTSKATTPGQPVLTTQLYFPDEPQNARDGIFRQESLMDVQKTAEGEVGTFNFVLAMN